MHTRCINGMHFLQARNFRRNRIAGNLMDQSAKARVLLRRAAYDCERPNGILSRVNVFHAHQRKRMREAVIAEVVAEGLEHFADHCAICHGNDGSGNTEIGRNLYPRSPDMRKPATQELSDGELFAIIRDGVRLTGMPGWGGTAEDNWKLVHLVRHLPQLTPEEIDEMERLNPKSPAEYEQKRREEEFLKGH